MYNKQKRAKKKKKSPAWHDIKDVLMSTNAEICINKRAPTRCSVQVIVGCQATRVGKENSLSFGHNEWGRVICTSKKIAFFSKS
jgi:hypothetical protein